MTLEARQISVPAGDQPLLKEISVTMKPGVMTLVIGPNGSGKTTLLNALAGEKKPVAGEVLVNDKPLAQWNPQGLARVRSVLPQQDTLAFPFLSEEVVVMGRSPWREPPAQSVAIAHEALQAMDAIHLAQRTFTTLSGGEKQRVQLARVLAQIWTPTEDVDRFLLLDEPVSALDLGHQYALLDRVKRKTREECIGALVTLHDLNLAAQFADELILLDQGKIVAEGPPSTVLDAGVIERVYGIPVSVMAHPVYLEIPMVVPLFRDSPLSGN